MTGKTHLLFGTTTGIATAYALKEIGIIDNNYPFIIYTVIGSLFPDIDTPTSILGKYIPHISGFIKNKFGHRTYTHDLFLIIILSIIGCILYPNIKLYGFIFGIIGHLFLDGLTINGIPFFYIKNKSSYRNIHFSPKCFRFYSNSIAANIVTIIMINIYIIGGAYILNYLNILQLNLPSIKF